MNSGKLFVGNLPWRATEQELKDYFSPVGEVYEVKIIKDKTSGKSRGFGFITMNNPEVAIAQLNGKMFGERPLIVSEAKQKN